MGSSAGRAALGALLALLASGCSSRSVPTTEAPLDPPVIEWTDAEIGLSAGRVPLGEVVEGALIRHDLGGLGDLWTTHITTWKAQYALVAAQGPPTVPDFVGPDDRRLGGRQRPTSEAANAWDLSAPAHRIRGRVVERADQLHPLLAEVEVIDERPGDAKIADLLVQTHQRFIADSADFRSQVERGWQADGVTVVAEPTVLLRLALDPAAESWDFVWIGDHQARTPAGTRQVEVGCPECPCTPDGRCAPCIPCDPYTATVARTQIDKARWAVRYRVGLDGRTTAVVRYAPRLERTIDEGRPRRGGPHPLPPAPR